jgi:hypothetical protein
MPIQSKQKVITRNFLGIISGCLVLTAIVVATFVFLSPDSMKPGTDTDDPTAPSVTKFEKKDVLPSQQAEVKESASGPSESVDSVNYYDHLPDIQMVIAEFRKLETAELDKRIAEVEQEIMTNDFIERSNKKTLDEQGYREFARLMQISDALYNVKIDRQLTALENELPISKKGA